MNPRVIHLHRQISKSVSHDLDYAHAVRMQLIDSAFRRLGGELLLDTPYAVTVRRFERMDFAHGHWAEPVHTVELLIEFEQIRVHQVEQYVVSASHLYTKPLAAMAIRELVRRLCRPWLLFRRWRQS